MSVVAVTHEHPFKGNGQRIRRARERVASPKNQDRPISQEDFAPLVPVSRRHLIRLENGEYLPDKPVRDRIVEITGTDEQIASSDDDDEEANRLNTAEGYCLFMTGRPLAEAGHELVASLRAEVRKTARQNERRIAELEEALR